MGYFDASGKRGIHKQIKVTPTNQSKVIAEVALYLLSLLYDQQVVRHISLYSGNLVYNQAVQLNLFESENNQIADLKTDAIVDTDHKKYGYKSLDYASNIKGAGR